MANDLDAIGMLQDPSRRALYDYVVAQRREVSRNEAAGAVGMQRTLAAFHLDRLAEAGLLEVSFRRLGGRNGPGAGRPAKLYRRAEVEHAVTVPPRDYGRAARVLAEAIERAGAEPALYAAARTHGFEAGRARTDGMAGRDCGGPDTMRGTLDALLEELSQRGYEPYSSAATVRLRNCPFHALAQEFPVVACGMNLALVEGMLEGLGASESHEARLDPLPGECCVAILSKINQD